MWLFSEGQAGVLMEEQEVKLGEIFLREKGFSYKKCCKAKVASTFWSGLNGSWTTSRVSSSKWSSE